MKKTIHSLSLILGLSIGIFSCGPATETSTTDTEAPANFGGLALYTVRDSMAINPKGTLKAVADAGYAYVESADY